MTITSFSQMSKTLFLNISNIFLVCFLSIFILPNLKNSLKQGREFQQPIFQDLNQVFCSKQDFCLVKPAIKVSYTSWLFQCINLKENARQLAESRGIRVCQFWTNIGPFAQDDDILAKIININFMEFLASFNVQNLKKIL